MYTYDRHKNVTEKILLEVKSNAGMSNHSGWEDVGDPLTFVESRLIVWFVFIWYCARLFCLL